MPEGDWSHSTEAVFCLKCGQRNEEFDPRCRACGEILTSQPERPEIHDDVPASARALATEPAWPLGSKISHYRLLELLGRGGMGVVYRAVDEPSGQIVAFKCLAVPHEALLPALRREIHALTRLRHPGIVRILDSGIREGLPWYAMELVEGMTLRRHASTQLQSHSTAPSTWWTLSLQDMPRRDESSDGARPRDENTCEVERGQERAAENRVAARDDRAPEVLRPLLTLVRRLCETLSYLHGEGLVHRDLKPDNVMVRADGSPVLVDFGLSVRFSGTVSREALSVEAGGTGTVAYMSPEQIRGETLDARADLYALGCMLYERVSGRPPFVGTRLEVAEGHLGRTPPKLSELAPHLGTQLDELLLRLLAKSPRNRIGHADVVAAKLERLGAEVGRGPLEPSPAGKAYLYRPGFSGREDALGFLRQPLRELVESGRGELVLVGGESGVGKTRLLMELGREVARQGAQALVGECVDGAGRPLEALRKPLQAVADRCRAGGKDETERLLGGRGKLLALYEPTLRELPGQEAYPPPVDLPIDAARHRLQGALWQTFAAMAGAEAFDTHGATPALDPVLLVLDDLQWADELTLGWLESLLPIAATERRPMPFLVVGAYRPEEVAETPASPLRRLLNRVGSTHVALGRLEERAVGAMVGDMLALDRVPDAFVRFLSEQSEGNPFFVAEYLRTAAAEGVLWRNALGHWQLAEPEGKPAGPPDYAALPLPNTVRELVSRRLLGLPEEALALCEAAAVLGREADVTMAAQMAHLENVRLDQAMSELLRRQILEVPGGNLARFVHDKIREVAYQRLEAGRRRVLHCGAAESTEALPPEDRALRLGSLGRHWEEAGETVRASSSYLEAAQYARERHAVEEADCLYRSFLRLTDGPTADVRCEYALTVLTFLGHTGEAVAQCEEALSESRRLKDLHGETLVLESLAKSLRRLARVDEAFSAQERGLALARQTGERRSEGTALQNLGYIEIDRGHLEPARRFLLDALQIHLETRNRRMEAITRNGLGMIAQRQGHFQDSVNLIEEAIALGHETGDELNEGYALSNLAGTYKFQGRRHEAQAAFQRALAIQHRIGDLTSEGTTLLNQAVFYSEDGEVELARSAYKQAIALKLKTGQRMHEALALLGLAHLERQSGQFDVAEALLERAEQMCLTLGNPKLSWLRESERAHLLLARGEPDADSLQRLKCLIESPGFEPDHDSSIRLALLARVLETCEAGYHFRLFRGGLIEDLPQGLRRWLSETGQLPPDSRECGPARGRLSGSHDGRTLEA